MKTIKYLFISRRSSHYRYYKKLVSFLGADAELHKIKMLTFPRLKYIQQARQLDVDELTYVHLERKKVRHPILQRRKLLLKLITYLYRAVEVTRASYYFSLFDSVDVQNLIVWNGQKQPNKTPLEVAKLLGINVHLFENGLLPDTTVLDPAGVNALNSLPRDASFYKDWYKSSQHKYPVKKNASVNSNRVVKKQLNEREFHKNRNVKGSEVNLLQSYIFVPFQVPNDTQIVCQSPWINSMESFYKELEKAKVALPPDTVFVIKEHPSWPRTYTELHKKDPQIIFANHNNTQELIEGAKAIVTINSTVGIEAILFGKKVVTLGNSYLNIEGLVKHCSNSTELVSVIQGISKWHVDEELREAFISFLKDEYLIDQRWEMLTNPNEHFAEVKNRLEQPFSAIKH